MKIIHCADLHINSALSYLPTEKAKIRREEIISSFERLCSYAKNNQVKVVIIAGDFFDSEKISEKVRSRVLFAISNCPETDFLYLSGNHDSDVFVNSEQSLPVNLKFFGVEWTHYVYGNVDVAGVCFNTVNNLSVYDTLNFSKENTNIAVMHGQVAGYKSEEKAEIISRPRLKDINRDYLALGHVHYFSENQLDQRGRYAYSGCLDGRGFDELGDKGFILLDVQENKINSSFISFSSRKFFEFEYDLTGKNSPFHVVDEIIKCVKSQFDSTSLVKVTLKGEVLPSFDIDKDGLESKLNSIFFFAKIKDKTTLKISEADYALDKSVRGEFVRAVLSSNLEDEQKGKVIMCGLKALKGEEF